MLGGRAITKFENLRQDEYICQLRSMRIRDTLEAYETGNKRTLNESGTESYIFASYLTTLLVSQIVSVQ
jgi:hypothetical protein